MDAIRTVQLSKMYGKVCAVESLNLEVHSGELFSLLGVNGAGKSSTIKMLCGLTRPTGGDAFLNGRSILREGDAIKHIIALSPQETAVAENLSVWENLELICGAYGFSREKTRRNCETIMERLGLVKIAKRRAGRLSGGYQRRLSIAMALVSEPKILFLDEPTLGLDVLARSELWELIRSLKGKMTIVLTTHYMEEAEVLSDRVGVMKDGRLLKCGTVEEIMRCVAVDRFEEAFIRIVKGEAK